MASNGMGMWEHANCEIYHDTVQDMTSIPALILGAEKFHEHLRMGSYLTEV